MSRGKFTPVHFSNFYFLFLLRFVQQHNGNIIFDAET